MIRDKNILRKIALLLNNNDLIFFMRCNSTIYNSLNSKEFWIMKCLAEYNHGIDKEELQYDLAQLNKDKGDTTRYRNLYFTCCSFKVGLQILVKQKEPFSVYVVLEDPPCYIDNIEKWKSYFADDFMKFLKLCNVEKYRFSYNGTPITPSDAFPKNVTNKVHIKLFGHKNALSVDDIDRNFQEAFERYEHCFTYTIERKKQNNLF